MEKPGATECGASAIADYLNYGAIESGVSIAGLRSQGVDGKAFGFAQALAHNQRGSCGLCITSPRAEGTAGIGSRFLTIFVAANVRRLYFLGVPAERN